MSKNKGSFKQLNKLAICIQVRTISRRIKKKALQKIEGKTLLEHCYNRLKTISKFPIFILTSKHSADKEIINLCKKKKYLYFSGNKNNVIKRYSVFLEKHKFSHLVRATCDNIFVNKKISKTLINNHIKKDLDYSTSHYSGLPKGSGIDIFKNEIISKISKKKLNLKEKEHINLYIMNNVYKFKTFFYKAPNKSNLNLSIDTYKDLKIIKKNFSKYKQKF